MAVLLTIRSIITFEMLTQIVPKRSTQESAFASGKEEGSHPISLDPRLHYAQLAQSEDKQYEGSGRNIFRVEMEGKTVRTPPSPELPRPTPRAQLAEEQTRLRFFGFAFFLNSPRRVFLSEGDAIFVGSEGEVVDRRYRIGRIDSNSVEVEDLIDHSVHMLSLPG
jgi:hypothetical protein